MKYHWLYHWFGEFNWSHGSATGEFKKEAIYVICVDEVNKILKPEKWKRTGIKVPTNCRL